MSRTLQRSTVVAVLLAVTLSTLLIAASPAHAATYPTSRRGDSGPNVTTLQYGLRARGLTLAVDGDFGAQTEARVRDFQKSRGLVVDGVVGNATWQSLLFTVRRGNSGNMVRAAQVQLGVPVDGIFGSRTEAAVKAFQTRAGLTPDGVVGPNTWSAMLRLA